MAPLGYAKCEDHNLYYAGLKYPVCIAEIERELRKKDLIKMRKVLNECNHKLSLRHNKED